MSEQQSTTVNKTVRPLKEWEVYTLEQSWPCGDVPAGVTCDRMLAAKLNDGWEIVDCTVRIPPADEPALYLSRLVTMKRRTPCPKCGELRGADAFCGNRDCSDYLP